MPDLARLRAKRLFLLDLDGTLYLDERLFDGAADFLRDEIAWFEAHGLNHALWVWEPTYEPWYTWGDRAMYYPFGSDPANFTEVENDLWRVIREAWARNTIRPSGGVSGAAPNAPPPQPSAAPSPTPSPLPLPAYSLLRKIVSGLDSV